MGRIMYHATRTEKNSSADMAVNRISTNKPNASSTSYVVETGIPVHPKQYTRKSKYPFGTMTPKQSVLIPGKSYQAVIGLLRKHKADGKQFTVRKEGNAMRIWRTR